MTFPPVPQYPQYQPPPKPEPPPVPEDLQTARILWRCFVVLNAIAVGLGVAVSIGKRHDLDKQMFDQLQQSKPSGMTLTQSQVDVYVVLGIALVGLFGVAISVLMFFVANWMRQGRHWARVMLTAVGAFQVASALAVFGGGHDGTLAAVMNGVGIVQAVLAGGAIFLMYRPDSTKYFLARRQRPW